MQKNVELAATSTDLFACRSVEHTAEGYDHGVGDCMTTGDSRIELVYGEGGEG